MDTKRETRHLEVLIQVARLIETLDLDEVLLQTLKLTTEVVGASTGSFFLLNEESNTIQRFISARELDLHQKSEVSRSILEAGLAGWVFAHKVGVVLNDTAEDKRWLKLDDNLRVRSALCVPVFVDEQARGVLTLEHSEPNHFSEDDLRLAKVVVNQAGSALHNAQLFDRVQTQEHQLEALLDSVSEVLLTVDSDWRIVVFNAPAEFLVEAPASSLRGKRVDEASENPLSKQLLEAIQDANISKGTRTFELRDNETRHDYVVNVAVLEQPGIEEVGYAIALYDVTSLKDLNRLKTHMLKMAYHDLKSPLGLLMGYVDLVGMDVNTGKVPDPAYIESIYKAINRMEDLIATLLDAHRSDGDAFVSVKIDPYELIQTVLDDTMPHATQHHHEIVQEIQASLQPIKGDFVQLREAMNNVFGNAIKYTPDGGKITISLYAGGDSRIYFTVEDTGYGVPDDQQSNIFKSYFRASSAATAHIEGTGVGLSLVKEVVERHGGQVWFQSKECQGSTFGFWLPLLDPPPPD